MKMKRRFSSVKKLFHDLDLKLHDAADSCKLDSSVGGSKYDNIKYTIITLFNRHVTMG